MTELNGFTYDQRPDYHISATPQPNSADITPIWFHDCGDVAKVLCADIQLIPSTPTKNRDHWTWRWGKECQIGIYASKDHDKTSVIPNFQDCMDKMVKMVAAFEEDPANAAKWNRVRDNVDKLPKDFSNQGSLINPAFPGVIVQA